MKLALLFTYTLRTSPDGADTPLETLLDAVRRSRVDACTPRGTNVGYASRVLVRSWVMPQTPRKPGGGTTRVSMT